MNNHEKVLELRQQEKELIRQRDNIEDMLEEIYFRIDKLQEETQREKLHN